MISVLVQLLEVIVTAAMVMLGLYLPFDTSLHANKWWFPGYYGDLPVQLANDTDEDEHRNNDIVANSDAGIEDSVPNAVACKNMFVRHSHEIISK